ncbi:MAG: DUF1178 family protein [Desulfobacula sp.]|nr:DUF1178 family protein [Desulfobacula sp.]
MIVFDLECIHGHVFEGWFDDKQDLETQQEKGILACPVCETTSVVQKVHPIAIKKSSGIERQKALRATQEVMAELTEKVVDYVEKNYEDVGSSFSKEALKMHYGVEEYRNIRGSTTKEEEKVLDKEGVRVFKVPVIKKESEQN